ncbi:MAG TPA: Wzz/FepE/Etk N-terminal domain-containing protein [Bryobacteraceae bacterium]|nr:Wzz/FepE/Etk N-terminal domain-containing protein [Bryobacteraceae bacterium]HXR78796.1 Wzz/FepE/Etk N-terminal domain-containing protein [Bryobacteraceae bacterium]
MLDRLSVPRRALDFGDYVDMLRRNLGWLIGPTFAGLVIVTVVAFFLQDTYVSQAAIRIVPQQISPELIQNVSAQDIVDRINGMAQQIQSRDTLTSIINTYGLYKDEMKSEPLQDVIDKMKSAVRIRPLAGWTNIEGKSLPAMQVSFSYSDKYTAQKVCAELVSRFMTANNEQNMQLQQVTNDFLSDESERAKRDLDQIESKIAVYREKNAGHLPEELQTNISQMNALENRASGLSDASMRNTEQRMMLESELQIAKDRLSTFQLNSPQALSQNQKAGVLDREIDQLQDNIEEMKGRYTDDYPGLQDARDRLALLKKQREQSIKDQAAREQTAKDNPSKAAAVYNPALTRERMNAEAVVQQLETQLKANAMELRNINKQMASVNAALGNYSGRIQSVPASEKEYTDLLHDRDLARQRYTTLQLKREKSGVSMELERRKQGETLEVIDAASLPPAPSAPKRGMMIPIGAGIGFALGVLLVGIREVRDTSLKNLKDARLYTQLSILGSVPLLENDVVVQRRKQVMWVSWATGTLLGLAIIAGSIAHHYLKA